MQSFQNVLLLKRDVTCLDIYMIVSARTVLQTNIEAFIPEMHESFRERLACGEMMHMKSCNGEEPHFTVPFSYVTANFRWPEE